MNAELIPYLSSDYHLMGEIGPLMPPLRGGEPSRASTRRSRERSLDRLLTLQQNKCHGKARLQPQPADVQRFIVILEVKLSLHRSQLF